MNWFICDKCSLIYSLTISHRLLWFLYILSWSALLHLFYLVNFYWQMTPFYKQFILHIWIKSKDYQFLYIKNCFFFFLLHKIIQQCLAPKVMCYSFHIQEILGDTWIYFSLPKQERATYIQCLGKKNVAKPSTMQKITPKQKTDLNYMSTAPRLANPGLPWWIR